MSKGLLIGALSVVMIVGMVGASMANTLEGRYNGPNPGYTPVGDVEVLFKGDMGPDQGLGCSNGTGNSGGPNDVAVGLTATCPPPFNILEHEYNIYTNVSPTITALSCVLWAGGTEPGMEYFRRSGLNWTQNATNTFHVYNMVPPMIVPSAQFFFGHNQPQTDVGIRWGMDMGGTPSDSFIRAPSCGANVFTNVAALGFVGNWTFSVTIDCVVPVELSTWGSVKNEYK